MDFKSILWKTVGWIFAGFFLLITVSALVGGGGLWSLIVGIVLISLCAPPTRDWICRKSRLSLRGTPLVLLAIALFGVQMTLFTAGMDERRINDEIAAKKASEERLAKVRSDDLSYFEKNKPKVLIDVTTKVQENRLDEALALVNRYAVVSKDPDLHEAKRIVERAHVSAQLRQDSNLPLARQAALYAKLAELDPENLEVAKKARKLGLEYESQAAKEREARDREAAAAKRKEAIERQFSRWDGSHLAVEQAVKQTMKNPKSYEHVETRYIDMGSKIVVTTTFRGTNSFGAIVPNTVIAEVDEAGNVIGIRAAR